MKKILKDLDKYYINGICFNCGIGYAIPILTVAKVERLASTATGLKIRFECADCGDLIITKSKI